MIFPLKRRPTDDGTGVVDICGGVTMLFDTVKVLISALVIAGVTGLAKRRPMLGGWIAALPLVTLLSIAWMSMGGRRGTSAEIARLISGVLWGMIPTAALLLCVLVCIRRGFPVWVSVCVGIAGWGIITVVLRRLFI